MFSGLKLWIQEVKGLYYVAKIKALIRCAVTAQLMSPFVFAYAKIRVFHDLADVCLFEALHPSQQFFSHFGKTGCVNRETK